MNWLLNLELIDILVLLLAVLDFLLVNKLSKEWIDLEYLLLVVALKKWLLSTFVLI